MKKKTATKIMSYLLTTAMIVGGLSLSPLATVEVMAGDPAPKNINLNVSDKIAGLVTGSGYSGNSTIYYASRKSGEEYTWKIVATPTGKLTLFSTGFIGTNHKYEPNTTDTPPGNEKHNNWSGSDICAYLNGTDTGVSGIDHKADGILPTYFTDIEKSDAAISNYGNTDTTGQYVSSINIEQKLVLPSVEEVKDGGTWGLNGSARSDSDDWWLRSPGDFDYFAAYVDYIGSVDSGGSVVRLTNGVRPAFNLNLSSVLFSSASKSSSFDPTSSGSGISSWKLTLKDESGTFLYERVDNNALEANQEIEIDVKEISGPYDNITAMVLSDDNTVLGYGKISDASTGIKTFTIPDTVIGGTKIKFFAEKWNVSNETDYAREGEIPTPTPPQTPPSSDDRNSNSDSDSNSDSSSTTTEEAYVNPLSWYYEANPLGSMCLIEHQGSICTTLFQLATPKGYKEAFSFNMLLRENGIFKPSHVKKSGKFVLNIPKEWQKPGRKFILIGIDKFGNTKTFSDIDFSDETFTTILDMEGYAFSLIYTDEP